LSLYTAPVGPVTTSVYNTTQNSSDNLPSYLQTNIMAQMLCSGDESNLERQGPPPNAADISPSSQWHVFDSAENSPSLQAPPN